MSANKSPVQWHDKLLMAQTNKALVILVLCALTASPICVHSREEYNMRFCASLSNKYDGRTHSVSDCNGDIQKQLTIEEATKPFEANKVLMPEYCLRNESHLVPLL